MKKIIRFLNWWDMFRACLMVGFTFGLILVSITAKANYYGYVRHLPNNVVFPLAVYSLLWLCSFLGFVNLLMVHNERDGMTGFMSGIFASAPFLFIGLWYSARLAHIAMS